MPDIATEIPIATTTLGSAAASYTFSNITSAYTDLVLVCDATAASVDNLVIQFNGDNASNYSWTYLGSSGSSSNTTRGSNTNLPYIQYASGINTTRSNVLVNIMSYSNTSMNKTALARGNNKDYGTDLTVVLWRSNAAITSVTILTRGAVNLAAGSIFSLYGIL